MSGLSLNYGDAWGLGTGSYSSREKEIANFLVNSFKQEVAREALSVGCDRQTFEDVWAEVGRKSELPAALRVIKRNGFYRNRVLEALKRELGLEAYKNKSFTTAMFDEKDIEECEKIGVTPEQMIEFLKTLY